jgi:hypothetical protein
MDDGCATGYGCCAAVTRSSPLTFADCASARRFICQSPVNQNRTVTYLTDFWKTVSGATMGQGGGNAQHAGIVIGHPASSHLQTEHSCCSCAALCRT